MRPAIIARRRRPSAQRDVDLGVPAVGGDVHMHGEADDLLDPLAVLQVGQPSLRLRRLVGDPVELRAGVLLGDQPQRLPRDQLPLDLGDLGPCLGSLQTCLLYTSPSPRDS